MKKLKFIVCTLASFMTFTSYGFAESLDVTVTTHDFPTESAPLLVLPISPGGWGIHLEPNKNNEPIAANSGNLKFEGTKIKYNQDKKESPCTMPQDFDPKKGVQIDVEYNYYQEVFICYLNNKP